MPPAPADTPPIASSFGAGPSSPPPARRRRQQHLGPTDDADVSDDPFCNAQPSRSDASASRAIPMPRDEEIDENEAFGHSGATDFQHLSRSYDDEDAALQAALRASMEDVPEGWVAPDLQPKKAGARKLPETPSVPPAPTPTPPAPRREAEEAPQGLRRSQPAWRVAGEAQEVAEKEVRQQDPVQQEEEVGSPVEELSPGKLESTRSTQDRAADVQMRFVDVDWPNLALKPVI